MSQKEEKGITPQRIRARIVLLTILALVAVGTYLLSEKLLSERGDGKLHVAFFDVGQGDAIYIESPTGKELLIDAGPDSSILRGLAAEMGFWDRAINVAIATHEDLDHIGGFRDVFKRYQVDTFVRTENEGESGMAHLLDEIAPREAEVIYARRGMDIDLGGGASLRVLFPDRDPSLLESNTSSIVARLTYGETEFLFTGDSPDEIEEYLVSMGGNDLRSDVLKLGHHGSKTSTSELFLGVVAPTYAVISSGERNRYGHPHEEVVGRLAAHGVTALNTGEVGTVRFESDGKTLTVELATEGVLW